MIVYILENPDVEMNMANELTLFPLESLQESFKQDNEGAERVLTEQIVTGNINLLRDGVILTNLSNSSSNSDLIFSPQ